MKTCVIIPVYNEQENISSLIDKIKRMNLDILVVDDGSQDNTYNIVFRLNVPILHNEKNQGKGFSLVRGFSYAIEHNFDAVITMDGDGQHDPNEIPIFLEAAEHSPSCIFIGNRMYRRNAMPFLRLLTNKFMSYLLSFLVGQHVPDSQCGFRLIKRELLNKLRLFSHNYELESEIILRAGRLGYKIESVPIKCLYGSHGSKINPFLDTWRFLCFIFKEIFLGNSIGRTY